MEFRALRNGKIISDKGVFMNRYVSKKVILNLITYIFF